MATEGNESLRSRNKILTRRPKAFIGTNHVMHVGKVAK